MTGETTYNVVYAVILGLPVAFGLVRFLVVTGRRQRELRRRADRVRRYRREAMRDRAYDW